LDYGVLAAGTGAYLQRFNADKVNDIWIINNQKIDIQKTYSVAFSEYLLKGFDIPFLSEKNKEVLSVYQPNSDELAFDIRKAVVAFLKNK
jgi:5'-nucleotidase/UDP-sugar diphosphatase